MAVVFGAAVAVYSVATFPSIGLLPLAGTAAELLRHPTSPSYHHHHQQ